MRIAVEICTCCNGDTGWREVPRWGGMIRDSLTGKVAVEQAPEGNGEQTMQLSAGRAVLKEGTASVKACHESSKVRGMEGLSGER